jgi:hypothetical protein
VYKRVGASRLPIEGGRSGLFIPHEMVTGAKAEAFMGTVQAALPARLAHELARAIGGSL